MLVFFMGSVSFFDMQKGYSLAVFNVKRSFYPVRTRMNLWMPEAEKRSVPGPSETAAGFKSCCALA